MNEFYALTVAGIATYGCIYALTAMGLVLTYTVSGIFNFAQGALGMIGAFVYWQLVVPWGWPTWLGLPFVVLILSPAWGAALEWLLMRRLAHVSLEARLTVTIGLLIFLVAIAGWIWNPTTARVVQPFFNGKQVNLGSITLTYHQIIVVGIAIVVAIALRVFLKSTRPGTGLRAVVDNRQLVALTGAEPSRLSMLGWGLGSSLASVAGILLAPTVNLDITVLTLVVVNGYAAAVVGRLRSLPLTAAGAIALGLLQSYAIGYLPVSVFWTSFGQIIPMLFLFVAILVFPQPRAAISRVPRPRAPRVPRVRESTIALIALVAVGFAASYWLSDDSVSYANAGISYAIIGLSLVLVAGYGGQVSLCQLTFAGFGAWAMYKIGGSDGNIMGLLAAIGLPMAIGIVLALPVVRLRALYLALATLAFAYGADLAFFSSSKFFGLSDSLTIARPDIGLSLANSRNYLVFLCVVFAVLAAGLLAIRRSGFGRRMMALNDSPAAALTLGIGMLRTRVVVFGLGAGIAGLGGALYGGAQGQVGGGQSGDFTLLANLTLLLLVVVWGIRTVGGVLISGIIFALGPLLESDVTQWWPGAPSNILEFAVGLAALAIAQNPEGAFGSNTPLERWRHRKFWRRSTSREVAVTLDGREPSNAAN